MTSQGMLYTPTSYHHDSTWAADQITGGLWASADQADGTDRPEYIGNGARSIAEL